MMASQVQNSFGKKFISASKFIPSYSQASKHAIEKFLDSLSQIKNLLIITGAGISTESGIPDYRSAGVGSYARRGDKWKPITIMEFIKSQTARQRYGMSNYEF